MHICNVEANVNYINKCLGPEAEQYMGRRTATEGSMLLYWRKDALYGPCGSSK